jgi:hypothetical protein
MLLDSEMLPLSPNFNNPVMTILGVLSLWMLLFFPFALWCRNIARPDALSRVEAFILGQFCGPVGVLLVMRANRRAAARAYRKGLLVEHVRSAPEPSYGETPEQVEQRVKALGRPEITEMPGGRAFRPPRDVRPVNRHVQMDTVGLAGPARPAPTARKEALPFDAPPPVTKATGAWRPPPATDPNFIHSDEKREDVTLPENGGSNG